MGAEAQIKDPSKQVWHGLVHPGHYHGQEVAVAGPSGTHG